MALSSIPTEILVEILQLERLARWPGFPHLHDDLRNWSLVCRRWKKILDHVVVDPDVIRDLARKAPQEILLKELAKLQKSHVNFEVVLCESGMRGHNEAVRLALENGADPNPFEDSGLGLEESKTLLMETARLGHRGVVRLLLDHGVEPTCPYTGWTALHEAARAGHAEIVKDLLERGADIVLPPTYYQPYTVAVEYKQEAVVQVLLEQAPDILARQCHGMDNAVGKSIRTKHMPLIRLLLRHGFEVDIIPEFILCYAIDEKEESVVQLFVENGVPLPSRRGQFEVLSAAVASRHEGILRLLLENGEKDSRVGRRALYMAARYENVAAVKLLLEYEANTAVQLDILNWGPLSGAVKSKNNEILHLLLECGKFTPKERFEDRTVLHCAIEQRHNLAITLLLDLGADISATCERCRQTPLHVASKTGQFTVINQLLDRGADVNAVDSSNDTALHLAVAGGYSSVAKQLPDGGVDITAQSGHQEPALHLIPKKQHEEVVELLLNHGADVTAVNSDQNTPLHQVVRAGQPAVMQQLLNSGADVGATNNKQATALHMAAQGGQLAMVEQLLSHGADVTAVDCDQKTALDYAVSSENEEMVRLLRKQSG